MNPLSHVAAAALAVLLSTAGHAQVRQFTPDEVERGRYLAIAGDCEACHTAPGNDQPAMAGGYPIVSPAGTIYSTNITPSRTHGIGNYTEEQFSRALREGVRADGARLYPAMPYTSYAGLRDADVRALYAWFMKEVAPVDLRPAQTDLPVPLNVRSSMMAWNVLFLSDERIADDPAHDAEWNRGRYLVETLGHCSTCHSPRGLLMQEKDGDALAGGKLGAWYAPNITPHAVGGIGGWSKTELVQYLATGHVADKAEAAGPMAEAITHSFSRMTPADLEAMATYIETVPAVPDPEAKQASYAIGARGSFEPALRGAPASVDAGAKLYSGLCASCHGRDGSGTRDGALPSLFHNSTVGASRPDNLLAVIFNGVDRTVGPEHVLMPLFGEGSYIQSLSNVQVAELATFVRATFGPGDIVTEAQAATARKGGPDSLVPFLGKVALFAIFVVAVAAAYFFRRRRSRRTT
ncbi:MAG TPA: cytochrome c [Steroidobacteraceae bacterium]|jgi:mono/diheme cytochrome c family protein|nr:cytochrome c [Steroidobacteraceae bacterium]